MCSHLVRPRTQATLVEIRACEARVKCKNRMQAPISVMPSHMGFTWHKNRCKLHRGMALVFGLAYQGKDIVFRLIIFHKALQWQQTTYSRCRGIIILYYYLFIIIEHITCPPSTIQKILIYIYLVYCKYMCEPSSKCGMKWKLGLAGKRQSQ
jgi:hypothetical protein